MFVIFVLQLVNDSHSACDGDQYQDYIAYLLCSQSVCGMTTQITILIVTLLHLEPTGVLAMSGRRTCTAPAIQNGAARLRRRGEKIKYKCYRGYSRVGPNQVRHKKKNLKTAESFSFIHVDNDILT